MEFNFTPEQLGDMKRADLQALAKHYGVRANMKNEDLIKNLTELYCMTGTQSRLANVAANVVHEEEIDAMTESSLFASRVAEPLEEGELEPTPARRTRKATKTPRTARKSRATKLMMSAAVEIESEMAVEVSEQPKQTLQDDDIERLTSSTQPMQGEEPSAAAPQTMYPSLFDAETIQIPASPIQAPKMKSSRHSSVFAPTFSSASKSRKSVASSSSSTIAMESPVAPQQAFTFIMAQEQPISSPAPSNDRKSVGGSPSFFVSFSPSKQVQPEQPEQPALLSTRKSMASRRSFADLTAQKELSSPVSAPVIAPSVPSSAARVGGSSMLRSALRKSSAFGKTSRLSSSRLSLSDLTAEDNKSEEIVSIATVRKSLGKAESIIYSADELHQMGGAALRRSQYFGPGKGIESDEEDGDLESFLVTSPTADAASAMAASSSSPIAPRVLEMSPVAAPARPASSAPLIDFSDPASAASIKIAILPTVQPQSKSVSTPSSRLAQRATQVTATTPSTPRANNKLVASKTPRTPAAPSSVSIGMRTPSASAAMLPRVAMLSAAKPAAQTAPKTPASAIKKNVSKMVPIVAPVPAAPAPAATVAVEAPVVTKPLFTLPKSASEMQAEKEADFKKILENTTAEDKDVKEASDKEFQERITAATAAADGGLDALKTANINRRKLFITANRKEAVARSSAAIVASKPSQLKKVAGSKLNADSRPTSRANVAASKIAPPSASKVKAVPNFDKIHAKQFDDMKDVSEISAAELYLAKKKAEKAAAAAAAALGASSGLASTPSRPALSSSASASLSTPISMPALPATPAGPSGPLPMPDFLKSHLEKNNNGKAPLSPIQPVVAQSKLMQPGHKIAYATKSVAASGSENVAPRFGYTGAKAASSSLNQSMNQSMVDLDSSSVSALNTSVSRIPTKKFSFTVSASSSSASSAENGSKLQRAHVKNHAINGTETRIKSAIAQVANKKSDKLAALRRQ